ncbi:hypothetical protein HK098_001164 [Nowakowskiella sp. JEL0407]|nr:hypothetical protein HK098_001164 [Nowakowskiella sp. JEL0407]
MFAKVYLSDRKLIETTKYLRNEPSLRQNFTNFVRELEISMELETTHVSDTLDVFIPCKKLDFLDIDVFATSSDSIKSPELFTPAAKQIPLSYPTLTKLSIWAVGYCDQTLIDLASMLMVLNQLEHFDICFNGYQLTNRESELAFFQSVEGLKNLRLVYVSLRESRWLDSADNPKVVLTEGIFECLQRLPQLRELDVRDYQVSSETAILRLNNLLRLDRLQNIWLCDSIANAETFRTIRRYCHSVRKFSLSIAKSMPTSSIHALLHYSPDLVSFQPEDIFIYGRIRSDDYSNFSICFEKLKVFKFSTNYHNLASVELVDRILDGLKSCRNLSKLEIHISMQNLSQMNNLVRSLTNLESLQVSFAKSKHYGVPTNAPIDAVEIYKVFSPTHRFLTKLEYMYDQIDVDIIFNMISEASTLMTINLGIELTKSIISRILKHLRGISVNRRCRLKILRFKKYQFSNYPLEMKFIGSGQWRLGNFRESGEIQRGIFDDIYKLWCAGDFTIAYVCVYEDENTLNILKRIEEIYGNVEVGLVMGSRAVWYKN